MGVGNQPIRESLIPRDDSSEISLPPMPPYSTQYRRSVQVNLIRDGAEEIEIYLQQRHEQLESYPGKWVCPGGVVDGLQNLSNDELLRLVSLLGQRSLLENKVSVSAIVEYLIDTIYADKEMRVFSEVDGGAVSARQETKQSLLWTLVTDIQREFSLLSTAEQNELLEDDSAALTLIYISTAKRELHEEAGIDLFSRPPSIFGCLRVASASQIRPKATKPEEMERLIYEFPVLLIDATALPAPHFDHDSAHREQSGLTPRIEAQADRWLSLEKALEMGDALPSQMRHSVQMLIDAVTKDNQANCSAIVEQIRMFG